MVSYEIEQSGDTKERQPLNPEKIFVIGGASGTGAALTKAVHKLGAEVIVSSTKQEKLDSLVESLGRKGVHTFAADLTNPEQFAQGLDRLIRREGIIPTAVVHSAAGGMENFSREMAVSLARLGRIKDPKQLEEKLQEERQKLKELVLRDRDSAMEVNFYGQVNIVEQLKELIPSDSQIKDIYWSSIWSDLGKMDSAFRNPNDSTEETGTDVPTFYLGVAGSKGRFVRWQKENADKLVAHGIYPAVVSGHIINDSDVGRMIDRYILSLLPVDQRAKMKKYYITQQDMVDATIDMIRSDPTTWPEYPNRVFVVGGRPVSNRLWPNDPMFEIKIPL